MKRVISLIALSICISNVSMAYSASTSHKESDDQYVHACQSVGNASYFLGSTTSPMWLNQDEAICRSQRKYPEYLEATKLIAGNNAASEEMRRLYVMNSIWDSTPSLHTGVMSFNYNNYIKDEPSTIAGVALGSKLSKDFMPDKNLASIDNEPGANKNKKNSMGLYTVYRRADYEKGYNFSSHAGGGTSQIDKIVLSSDPKINEELTNWKGSETGFFAKLGSKRIKPFEEYLPKNVDVLGVGIINPQYLFDTDDELTAVWGFLAYRKNLQPEIELQKAETLFNVLITRLGEPTLKVKNNNSKLAIWIGKNGTRVDFLCNQRDGNAECIAGSVIKVQRSNARGSDKTGADFFN